MRGVVVGDAGVAGAPKTDLAPSAEGAPNAGFAVEAEELVAIAPEAARPAKTETGAAFCSVGFLAKGESGETPEPKAPNPWAGRNAEGVDWIFPNALFATSSFVGTEPKGLGVASGDPEGEAMPGTSFFGVSGGFSGVTGAPKAVPKTLVVGCDARAPNALVATEVDPNGDDPESGVVFLSADVKLLVPLPAKELNAFPDPIPAALANEAGLLANAPNPPLVVDAAGDDVGVVDPNALCPNAGCPNADLPNDDWPKAD